MFMVNISNPFAGKLEGPDWKNNSDQTHTERLTPLGNHVCPTEDTP